MAIKVDRLENKRVVNTYPWLGVNRGNKSVILFTAYRSGVLLDTGTYKGHPVGHVCHTWIEDNFEHYEGSLLLSNP